MRALRAWLPLALAARIQARSYAMALRGCTNQTYDMSDLATIAGSQRGVWEELGSVVPWWSVLSSPEFDGTNTLNEDKMRTFYETGEEAVAKALARTAEIARTHGARAVWSGGGIGSMAIDFGCGVGRALHCALQSTPSVARSLTRSTAPRIIS